MLWKMVWLCLRPGIGSRRRRERTKSSGGHPPFCISLSCCELVLIQNLQLGHTAALSSIVVAALHVFAATKVPDILDDLSLSVAHRRKYSPPPS